MIIRSFCDHYCDVIMGVMASQITGLTIVYSTVHSGADQRKQQGSASLACVRGIHRWPVNSPYKCPLTRKMLPFDDFIMLCPQAEECLSNDTHIFQFKNGKQVFPASWASIMSKRNQTESLSILISAQTLDIWQRGYFSYKTARLQWWYTGYLLYIYSLGRNLLVTGGFPLNGL